MIKLTMTNKHNKTLEKVINNPSIIKELRPFFIFAEPIIYKTSYFDGMEKGIKDKAKQTDIIFGFNGYAIPIEIKSSMGHKDKAIMQIQSTRDFIIERLGLAVPYGKIVFYGTGALFYQTINLK